MGGFLEWFGNSLPTLCSSEVTVTASALGSIRVCGKQGIRLAPRVREAFATLSVTGEKKSAKMLEKLLLRLTKSTGCDALGHGYGSMEGYVPDMAGQDATLRDGSCWR